jgi:hypothetical protein
MAYIVPKVLIAQEFTQLPVYREFPLAAFIIGPQYSLTRYTVADEKPFTAVVNPSNVALGNAYQATETVTYEIPNVPAGGHSDSNYTKVYFENAVASYFPRPELGANPESSDDYTDFVTSPSGGVYKNRVRPYLDESSDALTSQYGYNRASYFSGRDVKVGDLVTITDEDGVTLNTSIKSLIRDTHREDSDLNGKIGYDLAIYGNNDGVVYHTAPVLTSADSSFTADLTGKFVTLQKSGTIIDGTSYKILAVQDAHTLLLDREVGASESGVSFYIGGIYQDPNNVPPTSFDTTSPTYGWEGFGTSPSQGGFIATNTTSNYHGHRQLGITSDTFVVKLTSGNNAFNARFSIISQRGAFAPKSNVPLVNNVLTLDTDTSGHNVTLDFTGATNFVAGKTLTTSVTATIHPTMVESGMGGNYTGLKDITYKVTVVRGGPYYNGSNGAVAAKVKITSSSVDSSGPIFATYDTPFAIGNYGVVGAFEVANNYTNDGLVLGDSYYIEAKAATLGGVRVIELNDNLPASTIANNNDMYITLSLTKHSVEVNKIRNVQDDTLNWTQSENYVTINAGTTVTDSLITANDEPLELTVATGNIFVHHRDLLPNNTLSISSASSEQDVLNHLGTVHPDNPLAQGVYDAVLNANGVVVYYLGVASDDLAGYNKAIEIAQKSNKVYGFVPLTFDDAIQQAVVAHVNAYSTPNIGLWRVAWLSIQDKSSTAIYSTKEDGTPWLATITQDLEAPIAKLNLLTVEGATFLTDGVRATDTVQLNYRTNADGSVSYDAYVVDEVRSQTTLTLLSPVAQPITSGVQVEIVRNYTLDERAANIAAIGGSYMNRRVRVVFPDTYKMDGVTKQGYFLAAALAGLRSGVVPHQGLTNTQILGADDLSKVVHVYNQEQLNVMAEAGIWIAAQSAVGAVPYVRHQLTTDATNLNTSEDSITTNVDSISYALMSVLSPYIGKYNINPVNVQVIRDAIISELNFRATQTFTVRAGNQLVSFTPATDILLIQQDPTYKDRIDVRVRLNVPYPLNYISLALVV